MNPIILLFILSLLWGSSFLWTKELLDFFQPPTIAFLRCLFGLIALIPFILLQKSRVKISLTPFFIFVVALGAAIPWNIMGFALKGIDSSLSGILNATTPLFAVVFSIVIIKIKPLWNQLASLFVGFIAVVILVVFSGQVSGAQFSIGHALLMFLVTSSYAMNSILINRYFSEVPPLYLGFWTVLVSTVMNGSISFIVEPTALVHLANPKAFLPLLILGCLSSGLGYVIFYNIVSAGGPILAVMVTFIVPFVSIALGMFYLGEPLHIGILLGLPLMLLSLVLMNVQTWKMKRARVRGKVVE